MAYIILAWAQVLSSKNPAPAHAAGPASRSSSKSHSSQAKDAKKAVKKSLSHSSKEEDEVDPAAMVADVQRLLAAVSTDERKQRAVSAGDKRTFNMKDRDAELLRAMEDEEAIALEAEKVLCFPFLFHLPCCSCCCCCIHTVFYYYPPKNRQISPDIYLLFPFMKP